MLHSVFVIIFVSNFIKHYFLGVELLRKINNTLKDIKMVIYGRFVFVWRIDLGTSPPIFGIKFLHFRAIFGFCVYTSPTQYFYVMRLQAVCVSFPIDVSCEVFKVFLFEDLYHD